MKIYISIPISGRPVAEARQQADAIKAALSRQGHRPVSPFDIYPGANPKYEDYMCADLRAMFDCDAIYMSAGWNMSAGCRMEYLCAVEMNKHRALYSEKPIIIIYGDGARRI